MTELDCVQGCATYFRSHQWRHLSELLARVGQRGHIHLFVNTSLHPRSLERLVKGCLELQGRPVDRGNEVLSPRPGWGTLHGIHPRGTPHFDMNWRFRQGVVLEPLEEADGEQGQNILFWDEAFMDVVYRMYEWRPAGAAETRALEAYVDSPHWHGGFDLIRDPAIVHIHVNVETSIHPRVLERFAAQAIARKGWRLHRIVPNVFRSQGVYYGKLMFLFEEPEYSFDMSWIYSPDVVLAPCRHQIFPAGDPQYMIVSAAGLDELLARDPHRILSDDEIDRCLRAVEI
jgi:hypothetical protein